MKIIITVEILEKLPIVILSDTLQDLEQVVKKTLLDDWHKKSSVSAEIG